jgi:hypothetical protein
VPVADPLTLKPNVPPPKIEQPDVFRVAPPLNDSPLRLGGAAQAAAGTGGDMNATTKRTGKARERRSARLDTVTSLAFRQHQLSRRR